jgi:hypothetical protein
MIAVLVLCNDRASTSAAQLDSPLTHAVMGAMSASAS